jgi:hypothetical protein
MIFLFFVELISSFLPFLPIVLAELVTDDGVLFLKCSTEPNNLVWLLIQSQINLVQFPVALTHSHKISGTYIVPLSSIARCLLTWDRLDILYGRIHENRSQMIIYLSDRPTPLPLP